MVRFLSQPHALSHVSDKAHIMLSQLALQLMRSYYVSQIMGRVLRYQVDRSPEKRFGVLKVSLPLNTLNACTPTP